MSDYLDPANEELLKDFFVEAELQVEMLEANILVLEGDPSNHDAVDEIFRAAHTLKGASATVQMTELAEFTHIVEDSLDEIRSGKISVDGEVVDTLLACIDIVKAMLAERQDGSVYAEDTAPVAARLRAITRGTGAAAAKVQTPPAAVTKKQTTVSPPAAASSQQSSLTEYERLELQEAVSGQSGSLYEVKVRFREDNPMNTVGGIQVFAVLKQHAQVLKTVPDFEMLYEDLFHPTVSYFVLSPSDPQEYRKKIELSDVTEAVEIIPLMAAVSNLSPAVAAPAVAARPPSASVPPPTQPPPTRPTMVGAAPQQIDAAPAGSTSLEESVSSAAETDALEPSAGETEERKLDGRKSGGGSVLRVDSRRIDDLLNLVSETVINKAAFNQISNEFSETWMLFQNTEAEFKDKLKELLDSLPDLLLELQRGKSVKDVKRNLSERYAQLPNLFDSYEKAMKSTVARFRNNAQNLGRITGELQEGVMRIRMVPISQIFSRFPRLVRDLSRTLQKRIELVIEGEDTELDKSIIEDLLDPLIHCVRNSIDHGIEDPATRLEKGKREQGTLLLRAGNEGNMIMIEISDDGKGIDVEAVRTKAIERGVIHPGKQLSDIEAFNLIFDPGFSTAREITNLSGRGVGLDVVKRQIEKLNGSVSVWSQRGTGTRFTIKIPLTLAIIQGLLVRVGKEMYAIPITSVVDSHRIKPADIKMIDGYEVFSVRDDVVSLIRLNRLFRIPTNEQPTYHYVVIVGSADRKMGLIVDSLIGEEDVVIKPLRDHFTNSPGIAGANITGDGRVSLIVDVSQLLELGLRREREERARRELSVGT